MKLWIISATICHKSRLLRVSLLFSLEGKELMLVTSCASMAWMFQSREGNYT